MLLALNEPAVDIHTYFIRTKYLGRGSLRTYCLAFQFQIVLERKITVLRSCGGGGGGSMCWGGRKIFVHFFLGQPFWHNFFLLFSYAFYLLATTCGVQISIFLPG